MRIQIAQIAASILSQRREDFLRDASLPLSVRGMINVHLVKPWIPNFWTVAIRSPNGNESAEPPRSRGQRSRPPARGRGALQPSHNPSYFDFPIGFAEDGTSWFFPSRQWWIAHAHASHPPDGTGCDASGHTNYLSREGATHEFDYASILADGTLTILGPADFAEECSYWDMAFGAPKEQEQP